MTIDYKMANQTRWERLYASGRQHHNPDDHYNVTDFRPHTPPFPPPARRSRRYTQ